MLNVVNNFLTKSAVFKCPHGTPFDVKESQEKLVCSGEPVLCESDLLNASSEVASKCSLPPPAKCNSVLLVASGMAAKGIAAGKTPLTNDLVAFTDKGKISVSGGQDKIVCGSSNSDSGESSSSVENGDGFGHLVVQGECLSSIAARYKCPLSELEKNNSWLEEGDRNLNILYPGEMVFIPKLEVTEYESKVLVKIRLLLDDEPRSKTKYRLFEKDLTLGVDGKTDGKGYTEVHEVSAMSELAYVAIEQDGKIDSTCDIIQLNLGHLDPIEKSEGVADRLFNLGFLGENPKDASSSTVYFALQQFAETAGLDQSAERDTIVEKLKKHHGS